MFLGWKSPYGAIAQKTMDDHPPISLHSIFELWISEFISNSKKKSSSKPTGYFVNFEIDFFFLQISGLGYDTFHISLAFNPLFTFHRSLVYLFPVLLDSLMPVHCIESTRLVNSSSLFFKILNSFYYPRLANLNLKLGFCLLMTQTERNLLK